MKALKHLLLAAILLTAAFAANLSTFAAEPEMVVVYAHVPDDWESPGIWAWGPRGDAFPSWPGGEMQPDTNNPGWYFAHIPSDKVGALINANAGGVQTSDFEFTGVPVWVTVHYGGEFEVTTEPQTDGDLPEFVPIAIIPIAAEIGGTFDAVVVYAYIVQGDEIWESPGIWAWGPRGDAFPSWPGESMQPDENNPGWYFAHLPEDKTGALINANDGSAQTSDFAFEGQPLWVVINNEGDETTFEVFSEQQTEGDLPTREPFVVYIEEEVVYEADWGDLELITVRAYTPAGWVDPGVWAWNEGDGLGNVFPGWPGNTFAERDGDWHLMQLPAWIDHIIINAVGGGVQTADIPVEVGRDIWIAILDGDGTYFVSHEPFDPHELGEVEAAPLPERAPPVAIVADPPPAADIPDAADDAAGGGTNVAVIVIIVAVVVVVLGGGIFVIAKKKKKA